MIPEVSSPSPDSLLSHSVLGDNCHTPDLLRPLGYWSSYRVISECVVTRLPPDCFVSRASIPHVSVS